MFGKENIVARPKPSCQSVNTTCHPKPHKKKSKNNFTMNFTSLLIVFASLGAANAGSSLRGADARDLATAVKRRTAICSKLSAGVYQTQYVSQWTAAMALGSFKSACSKICNSLCADYASFAVSGGKCTCLAAVAAVSATEKVNPCDKRPCASNQICSNTAESFTCEPILCANPYGNPCGPGRACNDTPSGFTCQSLISSDICPVSCGPDSTCVQGKCECNEGFYRPKPYLGCVAKR
jgi:hypothetical protein